MLKAEASPEIPLTDDLEDPILDLLSMELPDTELIVAEALDYLREGHEPAAELLAAAGIAYSNDSGRLELQTRNAALDSMLLIRLSWEPDAHLDLRTGVLSVALGFSPEL